MPAVSPTGVRGLMMLTNPTASEMGVADRTDAAQSIDGGARYLRSIKDRLPDSITGDDRLYMAMAAYNVGLGHLYDARKIAEMRGGDPDRPARRRLGRRADQPEHREARARLQPRVPPREGVLERRVQDHLVELLRDLKRQGTDVVSARNVQEGLG